MIIIHIYLVYVLLIPYDYILDRPHMLSSNHPYLFGICMAYTPMITSWTDLICSVQIIHIYLVAKQCILRGSILTV
jgi:hypothetical protein